MVPALHERTTPMESDDSEALIKLLINISTRELTIIED